MNIRIFSTEIFYIDSNMLKIIGNMVFGQMGKNFIKIGGAKIRKLLRKFLFNKNVILLEPKH